MSSLVKMLLDDDSFSYFGDKLSLHPEPKVQYRQMYYVPKNVRIVPRNRTALPEVQFPKAEVAREAIAHKLQA
jgi:hypothetical protein